MKFDGKNSLVSVIIPNWNGVELLKICLPSLLSQTFKNFEVIIVDNGSEDSSVEFVQKKFPKFLILKLEKNYGFAKAVNEGIKKAHGDYVFLLNNDTEIDNNCLKYLVESIKDHSKVGFVTAKILQFNNRNLIADCGNDINAVGHLLIRGLNQKDGPKFSSPGYIFLASGNGTLFKKEVFESVGFFDEDYFFYMEDADFCLRSQWQGFKGWFEPRAKIYHLRMATSSKMGEWVDYLVFRNMMVTVIKNFPLKIFFKNFNFLKIILVNINTIRFLTSKGLLWEAIKAESYILFNFPAILKKREKIQRNKKVTDEYMMDNILYKSLPKL